MNTPLNALPGVLFVLPWSPEAPGGVSQVVINLYDQARVSERYRPYILVQSWEDRTPKCGVLENRQIISFQLRSWGYAATNLRAALGMAWSLPNRMRALATLLRRLRITVVNVHYPTQTEIDFQLLRRLGLYRGSIVTSVHGSDVQQGRELRGVERALWKAQLASSDAIVCCSAALRREILEEMPALAAKTCVIHNGVRSDLVDSRTASPLNLPGRYVVTVATYEKKKGLDTLLLAFQRLRDERSANGLSLVLAGREGPELSRLRDLAHNLGLDGVVRFLVDVPHAEIPSLLAHAELFVLPSRSEPFGISILEAALFGLPVIATAVGGIPEIIDRPALGTLVPPDDPGALYAALLHFLQKPDEARSAGRELRSIVVSTFTWGAAFERYRLVFVRSNPEKAPRSGV